LVFVGPGFLDQECIALSQSLRASELFPLSMMGYNVCLLCFGK
jgi:hypothetical protein